MDLCVLMVFKPPPFRKTCCLVKTLTSKVLDWSFAREQTQQGPRLVHKKIILGLNGGVGISAPISSGPPSGRKYEK